MFTEEIKKISKEIQEKLINIRRTIHMHPELAFEEHATAQLIYNYLKDLDIEVTPGIAKTGVVGLIRGNQPGKTVAIRADMDALPMTEENECEYKSTVPGKMHACGHDVHVTCLLGAAEILSRLKGKLNGNIKLLFQPAEEGVGGALPMIEEGVLENPKVDACIAAHVWPDIPAGKIVVKNGPIMASPDDFEIIIKGKSGHGAMPHAAVDPIVIGCHVVNTLQTIVSRKIDPLNPAVISICYFHSGTCTNVIPDTATIKGTARTIDPELRRKIASLIEETVAGVVKAMGGEYEFDFKYLYPPTINDDIITDVLANSASKIIGKSNILWGREPSMGGEDFAYFAEKVPSTFFRLGCGNPEKGITHPIHSTKFDVDEDCIAVGASILAQFAVDYLNR
ncbi:M20 metallopeptidase family protein [Petroclostridium xylanilyticum]|uniref:M20 metallopeptidase family protein n=1 Tax=Petroclostridium xylanilyticum TaxID=1792311 RepID=UPI000B985FBB|nr:M20 family metallopeptidase [Petroclostridium xylanilyticum]